jgi:hypothetical protein
MTRLITLILVTVWALLVFNSCGFDIRHSGKVEADINAKIDFEFLNAFCKDELGLIDIAEEELTEEEKEAINECVMEEYVAILQEIDNAE